MSYDWVDDPNETRTVPGEPDPRLLKTAYLIRMSIMAVLIVFLILGAFGLYGPRESIASDSAGDWSITVYYPSITRAGYDTPWRVKVTRKGGFDGPITLRTTGSYFERLDENGMDPESTSFIRDGEWQTLEFDPPDGEVLMVSFDGRLSPSVLRGFSATTQVLVEDEPIVSVDYKTRVLP